MLAILLGTGAACDATPNERRPEDPTTDPPADVGEAESGGIGASLGRRTSRSAKPTPPSASPAPTPSPPPAAPDLYDPDTIPHFELTFDAAAMAVLTSVAEADNETWVHASFKMGSVVLADVGVRRKGSSTFRALPSKASFKVKLNKYVKGQDIYGLNDITLNNQVSSGNFLSERLAYHVFRSLGVPAPRSNSARVTINGEDYGLYLNVETPDPKFLKRVFGTKAKTLYEAQPKSQWVPGGEGGFEIDVEDPAAPAGTRPDLTALFAAVAAANDETLLADVGTRLDTTEWLRFSLAEALVSHWDGYGFSAGSSKNYFLAGDVDGKFSLIPWSTDLTFPIEHTQVDASMPTNTTLLARCKVAPSCWTSYKNEASKVVAQFENLDLLSLAKKWHAQIDPLVQADPKRETSLLWYQQRTTGLYEFIETRPGIVRAQLGI